MRVLVASSFSDYLTAWATLGAAVGTISAVLIALYRDTWRAWRRRPRLSLSFGAGNKGSQTWSTTGGSAWLPGLRLKVTNAKGRDSAEDVEVLFTFWSPDKETPRVEDRALLWASPYEGDEVVTKMTIAPGVSRELEFIRLGRPWALDQITLGRSRALENPPELHRALMRRARTGQQTKAGFGVEQTKSGLQLSRLPAQPCAGLVVAPPFSAASRPHILLKNVTYRFRLIVSARNADADAYEAVARLWVGSADRHDLWAPSGFGATWVLRRMESLDAPGRLKELEPPPKSFAWRPGYPKPAGLVDPASVGVARPTEDSRGGAVSSRTKDRRPWPPVDGLF